MSIYDEKRTATAKNETSEVEKNKLQDLSNDTETEKDLMKILEKIGREMENVKKKGCQDLLNMI